jgi:O-antigen/teichoic acid export membrane protein
MLNSKIDIVILGAFHDAESIGRYNVALRLSELAGLALFIINFVLAPVVSELYHKNNLIQLQRWMTRSARALLLVSVPVILLLIIYRQPVLHFFGAEYVSAQWALMILCLGQLINVAFGSPGLLLAMAGSQKYSNISLFCSIIVNISLSLTLTPLYGIEGVAIATSVGIFVWNFLMNHFVRTKLKINTTAFGVI